MYFKSKELQRVYRRHSILQEECCSFPSASAGDRGACQGGREGDEEGGGGKIMSSCGSCKYFSKEYCSKRKIVITAKNTSCELKVIAKP